MTRIGRNSLLILSLDTTTRAGSVSVVRDNTVLAEFSGDPTRTHGQRLPVELMRALEQARTPLDDIDLLAIAVGPGSFTGLRVGIATLQGLAVSRGLKIVPVPTLEALARGSTRDSERPPLIGPWMDAQRGEVFAMLYGPGRQVLAAATSATPAETLTAWREAMGGDAVLFAGDGALRYRDVIAATLGPLARFPATIPALASVIGRIAAREPERAVAPHAVVPLYVRRSDAELARERHAPQ